MTKKIFKLGLLVFLSLLVSLRVWAIDRVPIELFGDELDVGLQGYSILTSGKDYLGNPGPVFFHSFSEYRYPMQLYLSSLAIGMFGLNEIGVRTVSVVAGFATVVLSFLLVSKLFGRKSALVASVLLLVSPWHFNFSRQANDAGILLPFIVGGTYFFIRGMQKYKYLLLSVLLFALSIYTYAIAVAFVPLFAAFLVFLYRKQVIKHGLARISTAFILGLVLMTPFIQHFLSGVSSERFSVIAVSSGDSVFQEVVDKRRWSTTFLTRAFYNTKTITFDRTITNYLSAFSTDFLFTKGDPNMRQGIEGFGQMYRFDIPLLAIGTFFALYQLTKKGDSGKKYLIILVWLFLAPIPSALTKDGGNHASRLILMLPPLIMLSSLGFLSLIERSKIRSKKVALGILIVVMLFEITRFFHRYFVIWPNESWKFWQSGYKTTLSYVRSVDDGYSGVILNNTYEPMLPRFLFYYSYDMNKFQQEFSGDVHIQNIIPGVNGFALGEKYYFGELIKPIEKLADENTLVVASAEKDATNPEIFLRGDLKLLKQVDSPTGIPLFYVFTKNESSE